MLRMHTSAAACNVHRIIVRVAGIVGSRGSNDPRKFTWGVKHRVLTPPHFWKKIFSATHPHGIYVIIILYSETRSIELFFFVIIYNRFVDSSKYGPRDFDPQVIK